MSVLRVTCVTKDELDPDGAITGLGGDGFYHSLAEAVDAIGSRTHQYWTEVDGESLWVEVAHREGGTAYLKTGKDGARPDSLLVLEECEPSATEDSTANAEGLAGALGGGDGPEAIAYRAERLALRTVVRMLVLNRYGRDEARLNRNREDAIRRISSAVENMDFDESTRDQLNDAVTRELHFFFASPPKA